MSNNEAPNSRSQEEVVVGGQQEKKEQNHLGCGILGRYPILSILAFAGVGIATGIGLSTWDPENEAELSQKQTALQWIGLIGDLFIRALKCIVLPLVFVNVVMSMVDMMSVGRASTIGWKVIIFYTLTTLMAAIFGILSSWSFTPLFHAEQSDMSSQPSMVTLGCNGIGSFLVEDANGTVHCSPNFESETDTQFELTDVHGHFATSGSNSPQDDISFSETLYEGVFMKIVSDNIFVSFVDGNFAAVVFFAIIFGIALAKEMAIGDNTLDLMDRTMSLFREIDRVLIRMITWVIMCTPFAVLSLIASALGKQSNLAQDFANVGYLMLAVITGMTCQYVFVYVIGFGCITRSNPFNYLKHIVPAQTMAFACSSSAATLPVTMECVQDSGSVPEPVLRFILPLGATINMDGTALYLPCACIWLAVLNGITPNAGNYILLAILATVGSAGAAPVPSASLVLILTSYNTVFNTVGTPFGFEFIIAIDWFLDRLRTVMNVTSDTVVCGSVAATTDLKQVKFEDAKSLDDSTQEYTKDVPFAAEDPRKSFSGAETTTPTRTTKPSISFEGDLENVDV